MGNEMIPILVDEVATENPTPPPSLRSRIDWTIAIGFAAIGVVFLIIMAWAVLTGRA